MKQQSKQPNITNPVHPRGYLSSNNYSANPPRLIFTQANMNNCVHGCFVPPCWWRLSDGSVPSFGWLTPSHGPGKRWLFHSNSHPTNWLGMGHDFPKHSPTIAGPIYLNVPLVGGWVGGWLVLWQQRYCWFCMGAEQGEEVERNCEPGESVLSSPIHGFYEHHKK